LYILIWQRTIASLSAPAQIRQTRIITQSGEALWLAKGQVVELEGFAKYWRSLGADAELPLLSQNQPLQLQTAAHEQKRTQPPPRYSEAQLVQIMERRGIGRPSTYAPTIQTLKARQYIGVIKSKVQPTELGMQVDHFLAQALPKLINVEFTAEMEANLDLIATGALNWEAWITAWNCDDFAPAIVQANQILPSHARADSPRQRSEIQCPVCQQQMVQVPSKKVSFGYFLKCESCSDSVLFWSDRAGRWEAPKPQSESASEFTAFPCPVCKKPLEVHRYQKDGRSKQMMRCSDAKARSQKNHADAIYFLTSKGVFWCPKYGELNHPGETVSVPVQSKPRRRD
jgi:DNA topoisomerase-1